MSGPAVVPAIAPALQTISSEWADYLRFRASFAEALDPRLYAIEHLDSIVLSGAGRFWASADGAIVAEIRQYPAGARIVHGLIAAGDKEAITRLIPLAEQWGRDCGCIAATIESRPGWARELKDHGYDIHQLALWKDLGGQHGA